MKQLLWFITGVFLMAGWFNPSAGQAAGAPPAKGEPFPAISLPGPKNAEEGSYLELPATGPFKMSQLKSPVVVVEIFSMYCPICQKEAPLINELYQAIEKDPKLKGKIKLIGLGAGNTRLRSIFSKNNTKFHFLMLPDEDFALHKALGGTRTPYFFVVHLEKGDRSPGDLFGTGWDQRVWKRSWAPFFNPAGSK